MTSKVEELAYSRMGLAAPDLAEAIAKAIQLRRDDQLLRDLRADERRRPPVAATPTVTCGDPVTTGNDGTNWGWRDAPPLKPPPGIDVIDRMVDVQDRLDRAEREAEFAKLKRDGGKP